MEWAVKRVSMKLALTTMRNADVTKLTVQFVWRAGFYLRDVSKTIDMAPFLKIAPALLSFLSTAYESSLKLLIASWLAVVRSRNLVRIP